RILHLTVTAGVLLIVLTILLGSVASSRFTTIRNTAIGLLTGATPTPTPDAGSEYFYFDTSPSWGKLNIDGRTIEPLPAMGRDYPLYLAPGVYRLVWIAEPFQTQVCLLTVPVSFGSTSGACPAQPAQQDEFGPRYPNVKPHSWQVFLYQS